MMLTPKPEDWTIVLAGNWNVAIFSPDWLTSNIFKTDQLNIDVPMILGLAPRIKGDDILFLPNTDKIILGVTEIDDEQIERIEAIAVKILELLPHTPVKRAGMNFGFKVSEVDTEIEAHFPFPDRDTFSENHLVVQSQLYRWTFDYEDCKLNTFFAIKDGQMDIRLNYELSFENANAAIKALRGKYIPYKEHARNLLETIYNLKEEE